MKANLIVTILTAGLTASGQTSIDLRTQARNIDFSTASSTRVLKTGTALPAVCSTGETYFKSDATPGKNLYLCLGTNLWSPLNGADEIAPIGGNANRILSNTGSATEWRTLGGDVSGNPESLSIIRLQGRSVSATAPNTGQALVWSGSVWAPASVSGGGAGMSSQLGDFAVTQTNATALTIGANCGVLTPCNVRFGDIVYQITAPATATIASGSGVAFIYVLPDGSLTVGHTFSLSCSGCNAVAGVSAFPADSIPLYRWTAVNGAWQTGTGQDFRSLLSQKALSAGTGISMVQSNGATTLSVDTGRVAAYQTGSAALDFSTIALWRCAPEQSITVPGAAAGDAVAPGWPDVMAAGLIGIMRVSAADTVLVRICNFSDTAASVNGTFRATTFRNF